MKKILTSFFIYFFLLCPNVKAEENDDLLWDYQPESFLESLKNNNEFYDKKTQKDLDNQIIKGLDITLVPIDLEWCIQIALENNYDIQIATTQKDEYKWLYRNSLTELLPDVDYRYQIQNLYGEFLVGGVLPRIIRLNPVYSGITVNYPLIGNGSQLFTIASFKNLYKARKHNLKYTQSELLLKTTTYYYDLLESKLNIEVLISNLRDRKEQLRLMQARYQIGIGSKYDILRAEAQYADAKQELISALNQLRLLQARLANIMGIEVTMTLYPFEYGIQPRELVQVKNNIDSLYNEA